jgi:uncharacterized protein YdhG (YjbR/CyaY superfamily)
MKTVTTVEEYLSLFPKEQRDALEKLRQVIKAAAPKAEEVISYGMPGYKQNGCWFILEALKTIAVFFLPAIL